MLAEVARLLPTLPRPPEVRLVCRCPGALRHATDALDRVPGLRYSIVAAPGTARFGAGLAADLLDGQALLPQSGTMVC